jgi:hypothetical protein
MTATAPPQRRAPPRQAVLARPRRRGYDGAHWLGGLRALDLNRATRVALMLKDDRFVADGEIWLRKPRAAALGPR